MSGEGGYPAYCCPFCHVEGKWRLDRHGDAVASWSCEAHLDWVLDSLQRQGEVTKVTVYKSAAGEAPLPAATHEFEPTDDGVGGLRCGRPESDDNPLPCWLPEDNPAHRRGGDL